MSRAPKPVIILADERKSHMTKAEIKFRKQAEAALLSDTKFKEKPEVKNNPVAHKEFLRLKKLFLSIGKNDGLYENAVNRYCQLFAECHDFEEKRERFYNDMEELKKQFDNGTLDFISYDVRRAKLAGLIIQLDKQVMSKRTMMLALEKENVMTIAASLRSIPKKAEAKPENPSDHLFT